MTKPAPSPAVLDALRQASQMIETYSEISPDSDADYCVGTLMTWTDMSNSAEKDGRPILYRATEVHPAITQAATDIASQINSLPAADRQDVVSSLTQERARLFDSCDQYRYRTSVFLEAGGTLGSAAAWYGKMAAAYAVAGPGLLAAGMAFSPADGYLHNLANYTGVWLGGGTLIFGGLLALGVVGQKIYNEVKGFSPLIEERRAAIQPDWKDTKVLPENWSKKNWTPKSLLVSDEGPFEIRQSSQAEIDFMREWTRLDVLDEILRRQDSNYQPSQSKIANGKGSMGLIASTLRYMDLNRKDPAPSLAQQVEPRTPTRINVDAFTSQDREASHAPLPRPSV